MVQFHRISTVFSVIFSFHFLVVNLEIGTAGQRLRTLVHFPTLYKARSVPRGIGLQ